VNRSRLVVIYVTELDRKRMYKKSHVQKIGGKILKKKKNLRFFLDLINLFWIEETMTKEGSKGARFICLTASVRELGLFEIFSKGEVVKEVFAYGRKSVIYCLIKAERKRRNFDKHLNSLEK
jgi:hypothetical protein